MEKQYKWCDGKGRAGTSDDYLDAILLLFIGLDFEYADAHMCNSCDGLTQYFYASVAEMDDDDDGAYAPSIETIYC